MVNSKSADLPNRRRLDPAARRLEVIEAAERLLAVEGAQVRVEDVVREANAGKGTFFVYFPTWDDLLEAIRARSFDRFRARLPLPSEVDGPVDWPALMDQLGEAFMDFNLELGGLHDVLFHSDFARNRPIPTAEAPPAYLSAMIKAGKEAGSFADVDADPVARLLFAVMHEAADSVRAGADRSRTLSAMRAMVRATLTTHPGPEGNIQ